MKTLGCLISLAALAMALSTAGFAASKNQGKFTVTDPVRVGSTDLNAGDYKAEWTQESGNAVKIEIIQHSKVVATTEGQLKSLRKPAEYDAVTIEPLSGSNAKTIGEIDFHNRAEALELGGE